MWKLVGTTHEMESAMFAADSGLRREPRRLQPGQPRPFAAQARLSDAAPAKPRPRAAAAAQPPQPRKHPGTSATGIPKREARSEVPRHRAPRRAPFLRVPRL